jgi:hypothetical protein
MDECQPLITGDAMFWVFIIVVFVVVHLDDRKN